MIRLRIHHFFDIIRDYGNGKIQTPHQFGHSYYEVAKKIYGNEINEIQIVVESDDICVNCIMLDSGRCKDVITHRIDFKSKEEFNNHLDKRIMNVLGYSNYEIVEINKIIKSSYKYLNAIYEIYQGNDHNHTKQRKKFVESGIQKKRMELNIQSEL